ncbi:MAG: hypothetical protein JWM47_3412, partial [Acidimicrobiales bacterium]|nr:hypothetical protein [Acidimicrobiales bacterium]
ALADGPAAVAAALAAERALGEQPATS